MRSPVLAALFLGVTALPAAAQDAPPSQPQRQPQVGADAPGRHRAAPPRVRERMARDLGLTEEQRAKIKEIRQKHEAGAGARMKAAMEARKAFADAFRDHATSVEELRRLHGAASQARLEALLDQRAQREEIRAVLTPEQREKAAHRRGLMEGMGRGMRHGMGMDPR